MNKNYILEDILKIIACGQIIKWENGIRIILYKDKEYQIKEETVIYLQSTYFQNSYEQ